MRHMKQMQQFRMQQQNEHSVICSKNEHRECSMKNFDECDERSCDRECANKDDCQFGRAHEREKWFNPLSDLHKAVAPFTPLPLTTQIRIVTRTTWKSNSSRRISVLWPTGAQNACLFSASSKSTTAVKRAKTKANVAVSWIRRAFAP